MAAKRSHATPGESSPATPATQYKSVTTDSRLAVVVLAAGKGTRLKSKLPKVLHKVGGKALLEHVVAAASVLVKPSDIFIVIGHEAERVRRALAPTGVDFVVQPEQTGTGDAMKRCESVLAGYDH